MLLDGVTVDCCNCGIEFSMTRTLYEQRLKDHKQFYCPNGHGQHFTGKTPEQKKIDSLERFNDRLAADLNETYAQREELIGLIKKCPVPGCKYRSRRQVPRSPGEMDRGVERVRADIFEHLVKDDHSHILRPQLTAGVPDGN